MPITRRGSEKGEGGLLPPAPTENPPDSFTSNYMSWGDKRLDSVNRTQLDRTLSQQRGETAVDQLAGRAAKFDRAAENMGNKESYRTNAAKNAAMSRALPSAGVENKPTRISDIQSRYGTILDQGIQRRADDEASGLPHAVRRTEEVGGKTKRRIEEDRPATAEAARHQRRVSAEIPGAGWYFDHRTMQQSGTEGNLSSRQVTAMGGKLSALKTPEDEATAIGGISKLVGSEASGTVNGRRVSDIPTPELAAYATAESSHGAFDDTGRGKAPTVERPQTGTKTTQRALREAGKGHTDMVATATQVARSEITPQEAFTLKGFTPKTSAYSEMQAQSNPGSVVETDYRNTAAHLRDVKTGTQSPNQGMFQFSQTTPDKPLAHALGSDTPTAIDTWMGAAGSGQPLKGTLGKGSLSPAKRMVDKDMPLDMNAPSKEAMGTLGTDKSVTPGAVVSAQHNEAIRRLSENTIGAIAHNQHGQAIFTPSSLIQESVWVETRKQAGEDSAHSARQQLHATMQKKDSQMSHINPHQQAAVRGTSANPKDWAVPKGGQGDQGSLF